MMVPMEYTGFGYKFLSATKEGVYHSGVDLNWGKGRDDLGRPVWAMAYGKVLYAKDSGKGFGKMVVIEHVQHKKWTRYAHLNDVLVQKGDFVSEGQKIGTVGSSGGNWGPHLHFDVIVKKLDFWTKYTGGMSKTALKKYYVDPLEYIFNYNKMNKWKDDAHKFAIENEISNGERMDDSLTRVELWETLRKFDLYLGKKYGDEQA